MTLFLNIVALLPKLKEPLSQINIYCSSFVLRLKPRGSKKYKNAIIGHKRTDNEDATGGNYCSSKVLKKEALKR